MNKTLVCGKYTLSLEKTLIMGVLNVTPDSFSDGGEFLDPQTAVARAQDMIAQGADIIDIGAESSRPGSDPVSEEEELKRLLPVVTELVNNVDVPLSIDTMKPEVARQCLEAGAHMINDITGLHNEEMISVVAQHDVPVVLMHMQGEPKTMQKNPQYEDVISDISSFFTERIKKALEAGVKQIILDPGIGFGKTVDHNLEIFRRLSEFSSLECPLLMGSSRKSFIEKVTGAPVDKRLPGTIASVVLSIQQGAHIVRVHDIAEIKQAVQITEAILHG